jgi:hypothetical protein
MQEFSVDPRIDVEVLGNQVGLDIPAEYREAVATQFTALMQQADLVLDFPLSDDIEPAALFAP